MPSKAWFKTAWCQYFSVLNIDIGFQFEFGKEQKKPLDNVAAPSDNSALRSHRLNEAERRVVAYAQKLYDGQCRIIPRPGLVSKTEQMTQERDVLKITLKFELQIEGLGNGKRASSDAEGWVTGKR